jgi:hypothetical protein
MPARTNFCQQWKPKTAVIKFAAEAIAMSSFAISGGLWP